MSNTTQQIRESLAKGERMSTKELAELNCWGPEDKQRASVAVCNMRSRGELVTEQHDGVAVHRLLKAFAVQVVETKAAEQTEGVVGEIASTTEAALDPGVTLVAAIIKTDGGAEQRVELTEGAAIESQPAPLETKDPGLFEVQRVTLADFVPAQPGLRLFLHRAGDVSIETVRSHFGTERVMLPKAHVRAVARKLLEFVGDV